MQGKNVGVTFHYKPCRLHDMAWCSILISCDTNLITLKELARLC